jgi:DNA-binding IclR family transcriptional regulator
MNGVNPSLDSISGSAGVHAVPALEKAIRILGILATDGGAGGSTAIAQRLGISQSTCYRTLQTLEAADWIRLTDDGRYVFSLGMLPFVRPLQGLDRVITVLRPTMERLAETTGLSAKLSARQGFDQVTLARVESSRPLGVTSRVGARFPVIVGASGACLLCGLADAEVDRVIDQADRSKLWDHDDADTLRRRIAACRRDGVCDNLGTHPQGIDTFSAPIASTQAQLALTLIGLRGDLDGALGATARNLLRTAARAATALLEAAP